MLGSSERFNGAVSLIMDQCGDEALGDQLFYKRTVRKNAPNILNRNFQSKTKMWLLFLKDRLNYYIVH